MDGLCFGSHTCDTKRPQGWRCDQAKAALLPARTSRLRQAAERISQLTQPPRKSCPETLECSLQKLNIFRYQSNFKPMLTARHETLGLLYWFLSIFTCYHAKVQDNPGSSSNTMARAAHASPGKGLLCSPVAGQPFWAPIWQSASFGGQICKIISNTIWMV